MTDEFKVEPYAESEANIPPDVLRIIPPEDPRGPLEQLVENATISISSTETLIKSHCEF